jgi:hypothetical protein
MAIIAERRQHSEAIGLDSRVRPPLPPAAGMSHAQLPLFVHALPSGSITDPTPPTVSTAIPYASLLPPSSGESLPVVEAQPSSSERHAFVELQMNYLMTISQPDVMENLPDHVVSALHRNCMENTALARSVACADRANLLEIVRKFY